MSQSNDLFHFTEPKEFVKNFRPRHGTVMGITGEEMSRLKSNFNNPKISNQK